MIKVRISKTSDSAYCYPEKYILKEFDNLEQAINDCWQSLGQLHKQDREYIIVKHPFDYTTDKMKPDYKLKDWNYELEIYDDYRE